MTPARAATPPPRAAARGVDPRGAASGRVAFYATLALALGGILPPIGFIALPDALALIGPLPTAISLIGSLLLAPAAIGVVAALLGLERVRGRFRARADKEHEHAIVRVLVQVLLLGYSFALAVFEPGADAVAPCLLLTVLALAGGWSFLLHVVLSPAPSGLRRNTALIADVALLSAFLHFGGALTAAWYPLYLLATFYIGLRLGLGALVVSAVGSVAGFAATVALTPFWQQQQLLVVGLVVALVLLPVGMAMLIRTVTRYRDEAAAAAAARARFVTVIGRGLRGPVDAMMHVAASGDPPDHDEASNGAVPLALPTRALLSQISEILDLATIEAGQFAPAIETFDLHALVNDALALLRPAAAQHGVALALRLDPSLPWRLRGWPRQFAQILNSLVIEAIAGSEAGTIRIDLGAVDRADEIVQLRLTIRDHAGEGATSERDPAYDPFAADLSADTAVTAGHDGFGLAVVRRLVELMGGRITLGDMPSRRPGQGRRWVVMLPLAVDDSGDEPGLDLAQRPVLLVTEDSQFAGELAEPLNAWNADTRWVGGLEDALIYVERFDTPCCPILIVDGRARVLPALSFVHRAAGLRAAPPLVLFVADGAQIGSLAELGDGELTGLLPAPLSDRLLQNALHALPLTTDQPVQAIAARSLVEAMPADSGARASDAGASGVGDDRVTPIAAHPRFMPEAAAVVDARVMASLRTLGGGDFLREVIDSFRADARPIMERIGAAAAAADSGGFVRGLQALRRSAGPLGGARLCELSASLHEVTAVELRQQGGAIVQRLTAELVRLDAALLEFLPRSEERRG